MILYRAHSIAPVSRPVVEDGAVAVEAGRIAGVGPWRELRNTAPAQVPIHDLGRVLLIPGLINAHTHLELSALAAVSLPVGDYSVWVRALVAARELPAAAARRRAAAEALACMRQRGTVAVGDVANESWTPGMLAESGLRGVVFHELFGFRAAASASLLAAATARVEAMRRELEERGSAGAVRVALAPHAPHTTSAPLLQAVAARARAQQVPLSIHAAESVAECRLLADGSGPLREFWRERGMWDDGFDPPGLSPVAYLDRLGLLYDRTLVVHAVHVDDGDRRLLRRRGCKVVTCPRSNEALGVGTAPLAALVADGIAVALGTDSLASSPDLDMFAEMAAVRRLHPSLRPGDILRMATLNGARALGLDDLGSIEIGKRADLVAVPVATGESPLEMVCRHPAVVHRLDTMPHSETA